MGHGGAAAYVHAPRSEAGVLEAQNTSDAPHTTLRRARLRPIPSQSLSATRQQEYLRRLCSDSHRLCERNSSPRAVE